MPHLRIETNVPNENIPKDFAQNTCAILADAIGKPVKYCVVTIVPNVCMAMGGTNDPCAQATLMSIGELGKQKNKLLSTILFEHVKKSIGVPADRMYITFNDVPASDVGFNGSTFHYIFGGS